MSFISKPPSRYVSQRFRNVRVILLLPLLVIAGNMWWPDFITSSQQTPLGRNLTFDILSVGSNQKPELQAAQKETFGRNARIFYPVTEDHDILDPNCWQQLTENEAKTIHNFCHNKKNLIGLLKYFGPFTQYYQIRSPGWICAQKRPLAGLIHYVRSIQSKDGTDWPDFLWILDDDTYVDWKAIIDHLEPLPAKNYAFVGVLYRLWKTPFQTTLITFPFGGYGTLFSRTVLERWTTPLKCHRTATTNGEWLTHACRQLQRNAIGELSVYEEGMSLLGLAEAYAKANLYTKINEWKTDKQQTGFCFHSDWLWGYFINYYDMADIGPTGYAGFFWRKNHFESFGSSKCSGDNSNQRDDLLICHHQTPETMKAFYERST